MQLDPRLELLSLEAQLLLPALERSLQAAALGTQPCQLRFLPLDGGANAVASLVTATKPHVTDHAWPAARVA